MKTNQIIDNVMEKEFDFVIYPLKLVIMVGTPYEELASRFNNKEKGKEGWDSEEYIETVASFVNLVLDTKDDQYKILLYFKDKEKMTMRNICHESFHVAISVCSFCNMDLGFNVGQDEHPAFIAGFVGNCAGLMFNEL